MASSGSAGRETSAARALDVSTVTVEAYIRIDLIFIFTPLKII
jgi:hypothetical protein